MKKKDIIVSAIFICLVVFVIGYATKSGIIDNKTDKSISKSDTDTSAKDKNSTESSKSDNNESTLSQSDNNSGYDFSIGKDAIICSLGEECEAENLSMDSKGEIRSDSSERYKIKYVSSTISKDLPEGARLNYYIHGLPDKADEVTDDVGRFVSEHYYVTFICDVTNMRDESWKEHDFLSGSIDLGIDLNGEFKRCSEVRCNVPQNLKGHFYIKKGETQRIISVFAIEERFLNDYDVYFAYNLNIAANKKVKVDRVYFKLDKSGLQLT